MMAAGAVLDVIGAVVIIAAMLVVSRIAGL
jgi:hypothetical protein